MKSAALKIGLAFLFLAGCDGHSPTERGAARSLPERFWLRGSASSTEPDGATVSCTLDLFFELAGDPREAPGLLEYRGTYGGGMSRTVLPAVGNGISLWPDVHGQVVAWSVAPDRVRLTFPANLNSSSRFWRELSQIEGTLGADGTATGSWNCAPFDINSGGWVDERYTARGTWTLTPAD